ncbi:hypothetical protein J1614_010839 [Plenodomus biglobosus]|nr:hypothetical protein J1614_010839 [Plenodomus biglobosus]
MSLKPVHIIKSPWFHPTGSTPPVCLTQNLPPEQDAALLLLGCGDIGSILFTAYSEVVTTKLYQDTTISDTGFSVNNLRAAAPLLFQDNEEIPDHYQAYWQNGTCFEEKDVADMLTIANTMFFCHRNSLTMHYGSNPVAGYHLAAAYAQLTTDSPLADADRSDPVHRTSSKVMRAAITQLAEWCTSFRSVVSRTTLRFVTSDALAFCHVLHYHRTHGESRSANWYRNSWTYDPLCLDAPDYEKDGSVPITFNLIDTSSLMDHLGCVNILTATSLVLEQHPAPCIRTEMLIPREGAIADTADAMLCGDLPTVALLLGLKPAQY